MFSVGIKGLKFILYNLFLQDMFIGFGGNVIREKVKSQAPWFVTDFKELLQELQPSHSVNGMATHLNGVNEKEPVLNGINSLNGGLNGTDTHINGTSY